MKNLIFKEFIKSDLFITLFVIVFIPSIIVITEIFPEGSGLCSVLLMGLCDFIIIVIVSGFYLLKVFIRLLKSNLW
jgi:hypothetical protein